MLPLNLLALLGLMAGSAIAASSSGNPASPSPSADVELICHTNNPAECYPKIFQATHEFQTVHDDQDLPPGLHVRLDVTTGKKEAKINIPDENDAALEGLPVDQSVVIVERDQPGGDASSHDQVRLPKDAPAYDPAGKIKEPPSANADEGGAFFKSLSILKKGLDVDGALEMLEDISHDIYYGLKIAEDYDTVQALLCLSTSSSSASTPDDSAEAKAAAETSSRRARLAALTLSSAVQNNPKALAEIEAHWPRLSVSTCTPASSPAAPLGTTTFTLLPASVQPTTADPSLTKARISLLRGLLRSPLLRRAFLTTTPGGTTASGTAAVGPAHLIRILTSPSTTSKREQEEEAWTATQRAAAHLLLDTFLDPDMGAAAGEWPAAGTLSGAECAAAAAKKGQAEDGSEGEGEGESEVVCLDWHVAQIASRQSRAREHWSHELKEKLGRYRRAEAEREKERGKGKGKGREKVEL